MVEGRQTRPGTGRLLLGAAGTLALAYGVLGLLGNAADTAPPHTALWLVGGILAHDLILAPAVAIVGWTLGKLLPGWARSIVQGGLVVAAVVVLVGLPPLLRQGDPSNYLSLLPLNYRLNLSVLLALVAAGTAALIALRGWRRSPASGRGSGGRADGST